MSDDYLKAEELAQRLRVKTTTIRFWAMQGLPAKPVGRLRFYDLAVVEAWLRDRDRLRPPRKNGLPRVPAAAPASADTWQWLDWTGHGIS